MNQFKWMVIALIATFFASVYYGYHIYKYLKDKTDKSWGEESTYNKTIVFFCGSIVSFFICIYKLFE